MEQKIWERKTGLLGVWGSMIESWLDQLLPDNAHDMCRNRVTVVVTTLPEWSQVWVLCGVCVCVCVGATVVVLVAVDSSVPSDFVGHNFARVVPGVGALCMCCSCCCRSSYC